MPTTFTPPPGFVQVESKLAGVTVFAPAPKVEKKPEAQTFQCPNCGATTAFDPAAASVTCQHCGFAQPLAASVVGQAAAEAEFTLEALEKDRQGWGQARRELHCDACGADMSLAPNDLSATCSFCASNRVVARPAVQNAIRPSVLIPFKVDPGTCSKLARDWLGKGWMHPGGLAGAAAAAKFTGVYLPFWTFDARITADWKAEVGYEKSESYYDHEEKAWKTRTVIDWRWENGRVGAPVNDMLGAGTSKVSAVLLENLYPFELAALTAYEPGFLAGWQAQAYDIPLAIAWETAKNRMRESAKQSCYSDTGSAHVRNFSMAADFADETWRYILLPVFIAAYRFESKAYQVMINGQTGSVAGQKPVAWWKVWLAIAALLAPGTLIGLIGLPLLLAGGIGLIPLVLGGVLFIIGAVISGIIFMQAMKAGEA